MPARPGNRHLQRLVPYPFQRWAGLSAGVVPADLPAISLGMGEPREPPPDFVVAALTDPRTVAAGLGAYPATRGSLELRSAISTWLSRRFEVPAAWLDPERNVLPVSGTREGLFSAIQALAGGRAADDQRDLVLLPNPFYQIYEGASLLAGCEPWYMPARDGLPDLAAVPESIWARCRLLVLCTPHNPTGRAFSSAALQDVLARAAQWGFTVVSDECYSEIYPADGPAPAGLLGACAATGNDRLQHCLVFHSLSKRSSLPGLRSGFVAGDAELVSDLFAYRTYHGAALPQHVQAASTLAWQDEAHVVQARQAYAQRFAAVLPVLGEVLEVTPPEGGFYLWPRVPGDDAAWALDLYRQRNVQVLPGSFLSRPDSLRGDDPGAGHVRMALVPGLEACLAAARRIRDHQRADHPTLPEPTA